MSSVITPEPNSDVNIGQSPGGNSNPLSDEKATPREPVPSESSSSSEDVVHETSDEGSADPERLARVSSGPIYSVFSKSTKIWVISMITVSSFISPMTANIYFPALNPIANDLGVSISLINLTLTTYMVFQGIAPTIFGDFGDVAGRRPAFIVAFTIYLFANVGLALQDNYAVLLALRMLQSGGSSGTLALSFAVVADISVSAERGKYMGYIGAGINVGPALSPVLGGLLAEYLSWRAIFWFCVILTGAWLVPFILAVPETCRNVVGNGSRPPRGWNMTLLDYIRFRRQLKQEQPLTSRKLRFPNPLRTVSVVFEKDMSLILLFNTLIYLVFIISVATLSTQFAEIYHLNNLQIGLCYLPYGIGCCVSVIAQGRLLDWNYRRTARKIGFTINYKRGDDLTNFPIEKARIQPILPILSIGLCADIAYGWVLHFEAPLAAALVLTFLIGLTITGSFSIVQTLIVDLYPQSPATAVAAVNLVRCLVGAAVMAFIENMLIALGRGWCFTFWALLCGVMTPILFVIQKWGPRWREERRLRLLKDKEKKDREKLGSR